MISDKKEKMIKELIKDHALHKLSSFAAMVALQLIVDPKEPSEECREWAENAIRGIENED